MPITETLALADKVSAPALRMALAVEQLDDATAKARAELSKAAASGGKFGKEASKAVAAVERQKRAILQMQAAENKVPAASRRAAQGVQQIGKSAAATSGEIGELNGKKVLGGLAGPTVGLGILAVAMGVQQVGKVALFAARSVAHLVAEFARGVVEAHLLRSKAKSLQDTLSGGRGDVVLARLRAQAIATGQSFEELQQSTAAARDAGVDYGDAFKLNLLRADIIASGRSAETADSAINEMLGKVKAGSLTAAQGQKELAERFRVAGDGAKGAAAASKTLGGALARLKAAPGRMFDAIAEKSGPTLDKLGAGISRLIDDFNKSGQAKALVEALASAMDKLAVGIGIAARLVGPMWKGFKEGLGPLGTELTKIGEMLGKAFGGKEGTVNGLAVAAQMVGRALGFVVGVAVRLTVGFAALVAAGGMVLAWFQSLPGRAVEAGTGLINGLVNGIRSGIARAVQAAKELADKVASTVKSTLKIGSPSKLFADYGRYTAQGMAIGITRGTPAVAAASEGMAGAPVAAAVAAPASAPRPAARGGDVSITLNVSAMPGATPEDGQAMAAGIVPVIRREIASWLESQLLEAGA